MSENDNTRSINVTKKHITLIQCDPAHETTCNIEIIVFYVYFYTSIFYSLHKTVQNLRIKRRSRGHYCHNTLSERSRLHLKVIKETVIIISEWEQTSRRTHKILFTGGKRTFLGFTKNTLNLFFNTSTQNSVYWPN